MSKRESFAHPEFVMPSAANVTLEGHALAVFCFDIGFQVDLDAAEPLVREATRRRAVRARRPAPAWFDEDAPPLRLLLDAEPIEVAGTRSEPSVELLVYAVGAVAATFRLPLPAALGDLPAFTAALQETADLEAEARRRVESLVALVRPAIERPQVHGQVEDYLILVATAWRDGGDAATDGPADGRARDAGPAGLLAAHRSVLARTIEGEPGPLADAQAARATAGAMSYAPSDLAIIDWNAAILFDEAPEDVIALLQHANVELLELRILEHELDVLLDAADETLSRSARRRIGPGFASGRELARFATIQTDAAVLFEGLDNALKLLGNQHLARLYRLAAERLDLPSWQACVQRKIEAADSLYGKLSDTVATRRLETLEWVIIVLIAVSIILPFTPIYH